MNEIVKPTDANAIVVDWTDNYHFIASQQGQTIHLDSKVNPEDELRGVSPKQLLLTGLGGCMGMDIAGLLPKMRVPFSKLSLEVTGTLAEDHPKYYSSIVVNIVVDATEEFRPQVESAVHKSRDKYCGVSAMLSKVADIEYRITLNGSTASV